MLPFETDVSSKYGAPMGRNQRGLTLTGKVQLRRVRLYGDYDKGGAYWGNNGVPLWCAWNDEGSVYVRAADRNAAKAQFPNCTFYR